VIPSRRASKKLRATQHTSRGGAWRSLRFLRVLERHVVAVADLGLACLDARVPHQREVRPPRLSASTRNRAVRRLRRRRVRRPTRVACLGLIGTSARKHPLAAGVGAGRTQTKKRPFHTYPAVSGAGRRRARRAQPRLLGQHAGRYGHSSLTRTANPSNRSLVSHSSSPTTPRSWSGPPRIR